MRTLANFYRFNKFIFILNFRPVMFAAYKSAFIIYNIAIILKKKPVLNTLINHYLYKKQLIINKI